MDSHHLLVRYWARQYTNGLSKAIECSHRLFRNSWVIEGQVSFYNCRNQFCSIRRESTLSHFSGPSWICPKGLLSFDNGPDGGCDSFWVPLDQCIGSDEAAKREMASGGRTIAPSHVEENLSHAPSDRNLGPHSIGPETVDLALLKGLGREHAE